VRTTQGPRQRIVATLGKLPGMEKEERIGWEEIARILDGKPRPEASLVEKEEEISAWAEVNLKGVSVERLEAALNKMVSQAEQGKIRNRQKVLLRIGRLLERNSRAASLFEVSVEESGSGSEVRLKIEIRKNEAR